MKLMMAPEFASTGEPEMSWFQRLSLPKGRKPLRLAPCPALIALQALWGFPPEPEPPDPLPPDPLRPPDLLPPLPELPDDRFEPAAVPPQFVHASINASAPMAASNLIQKGFMPSLS